MDKLAPKTSWKDLKDLARLWLGESIRRTEEYKCSMLQSQDGANVTKLTDKVEKLKAYSDVLRFIRISELAISP